MPLQGDRINYLKVSRWDREGLLLKPGVPSAHMVFGHLQPGQFPESEGQAGLFLRKLGGWEGCGGWIHPGMRPLEEQEASLAIYISKRESREKGREKGKKKNITGFRDGFDIVSEKVQNALRPLAWAKVFVFLCFVQVLSSEIIRKNVHA